MLEIGKRRRGQPPPPDDALTGHLRKRLNQLINAELRSTFGQ